MLEQFLRGGQGCDWVHNRLAQREEELKELKEKNKALAEACQRDFIRDNSDQLCTVISTKNAVIKELQSQLQDHGKDGVAAAVDAAVTSTAALEKLRAEMAAVQARVKAQEEELDIVTAERDRAKSSAEAMAQAMAASLSDPAASRARTEGTESTSNTVHVAPDAEAQTQRSATEEEVQQLRGTVAELQIQLAAVELQRQSTVPTESATAQNTELSSSQEAPWHATEPGPQQPVLPITPPPLAHAVFVELARLQSELAEKNAQLAQRQTLASLPLPSGENSAQAEIAMMQAELDEKTEVIEKQRHQLQHLIAERGQLPHQPVLTTIAEPILMLLGSARRALRPLVRDFKEYDL